MSSLSTDIFLSKDWF